MEEFVRRASIGDTPGVAALLGHADVDVNKTVRHPQHARQTALFAALREDHQETALLLLGQPGIDYNFVGYHGESALYLASRCGNLRVVNELLAKPNIVVDTGCTRDSCGVQLWTPLLIAIKEDHADVVRALLPRADVRSIWREWQSASTPSAFWFACAFNSHRSIGMLLDDPRTDFRDHTGSHYTEVPIVEACVRGNMETIQIIMDHPLAAERVSKIDRTNCLRVAAQSYSWDQITATNKERYMEIARLFMRKDANLDVHYKGERLGQWSALQLATDPVIRRELRQYRRLQTTDNQ